MHKRNIKCKKVGGMHRGLPGQNITKLAFHHGGMIIKSPSAYATLVDFMIHYCSYYDIRGCNAET